MLSLRLTLGCSIAVLIGLFVLGEPRLADACPPLSWEASILIPPEGAEPMPIDGALLAVITAPNDNWEQSVSLTDADGVEVPVVVVLELTGSNEQTLLRAQPRAPLAPQTEYTWSIGPDGQAQRTFVTGDEADLVAPTPGEPVATLVESGIGDGCSPEAPWTDYDIEVPELSEAVATLAIVPAPMPTEERPHGRIEGANGAVVRVRLYSDVELCWDVQVEDHGGHVVPAGTVCLGGPAEESSSSGDGGSSSGGAETADGTTTGEVPATTGDSEASTTVAAGSSDSAPAVDDDAPAGGGGCGCAASPRSPGGGFLLLPLLLARRRSRPRAW
jgi:hypothetical protein